jgi:cobalamin synthase
VWPRLGFRGWVTLILVLAVSVAALVAVAAIALGILLFLLPALAVGALLFYLFPSKFRQARHPPNGGTTIDGEFRVVDAAELERRRKEESET